METFHVVPLNDLHPHIDSSDCECRPVQDSEQPNLWIHNAYDGRELKERIAAVRDCPSRLLSNEEIDYLYNNGEGANHTFC